ncbi:hypothetical protein CDD83_10468 [Cordyceps sp. RAO-2017]|nr:hypothetical protein CDD83_10468 [Cordyceps sp. RAO-2017]
MKKLPFKPTALRRASLPKPAEADGDATERAGGDDDDDLAIFRRSKEMEPIMAADRERRLKKRLQKQGDDRRRRPSALPAKRPHQDGADADGSDDGGYDASHVDDDGHDASHIDVADEQDFLAQQDIPDEDVPRTDDVNRFSSSRLVTPPASKRSRLDSTPSKISIISLKEAGAAADDSPSTRLAKRTPDRAASATKSVKVISLDSEDDDDDDSDDDDDDDDDVQEIVSPRNRRDGRNDLADDANAAPVPPPPPIEDDEFGEYVRMAEEQRARDYAMLRGGGTDKARTREAVDILVTSSVANARPCRMRFLFDKPLRLVRNSWLALQRSRGVQLELAQDDDVILTWRRNKVYPFSTLLNLGIRPHVDGQVQVDGRDRAGLTDNRAGVHMEAWTPALFHEMEREEEARRRREAGESSEAEASEAEAAEARAAEVKIRVILRARQLDDVRLTVRPETTVETLLTGFRAQRGVGSDEAVSLWFDGERLEEHVTMEAAEIDDLDTMEVHVK